MVFGLHNTTKTPFRIECVYICATLTLAILYLAYESFDASLYSTCKFIIFLCTVVGYLSIIIIAIYGTYYKKHRCILPLIWAQLIVIVQPLILSLRYILQCMHAHYMPVLSAFSVLAICVVCVYIMIHIYGIIKIWAYYKIIYMEYIVDTYMLSSTLQPCCSVQPSAPPPPYSTLCR